MTASKARGVLFWLCVLAVAAAAIGMLLRPTATRGAIAAAPRLSHEAETPDSQKAHGRTNALIREKSPYLHRHAFDPVDWQPWGEAAFAMARSRNVPIFLSIGYSSCFACYTMQRDVFENPEIAGRMNSFAVNILVDREERPDIDRLYMSVLQTISGTGGWPMSFFLTPERKPFFGATFLSAPAFDGILNRVHNLWLREPKRLADSGNLIASYLDESAGNPSTRADASVLKKGYENYKQLYDPLFGGFGSAPKFPHPMILNFLLRYHERTGEKEALEMSLNTLRQMAAGAVFDHVGYGFHRYSEDDQWRTPHFEKMLYDQALLSMAYLEAFQVTKDPQYSRVAGETLTYVLQEMQSPEGAFYGAVDAASAPDPQSSDKQPGAYYLWTKSQVEAALPPDDVPPLAFAYGIRPEGNTLQDPMKMFGNRNVLFRAHTLAETAARFHRKESDMQAVLDAGLKRLLEARKLRPAPAIDDKVLLSWNALMISALARAAAALDQPSYLAAAARCRDFLEQRLRDPGTGKLLRRYRNGEARYDATLQDYALYVQALLDLYEASLDVKYLQRAMAINGRMVELFEDSKQGGFFDTVEEDRSLPARIREFYDDSEPTGNSIAILNLLRLSEMTGDGRCRELARRALQFFAERMNDQPESMPQFLVALQFSLQTPKHIVIAGPAADPRTKILLRVVREHYLPETVLLLAEGGESQEFLSRNLPFLAAVHELQGRPTAYVCENEVCKLPTSDPRVLASLLETRSFDRAQR